jgi:hypothetical protein
MSIRSEARIRQMIARYPRCAICGNAMVAGQKGTHLSCRANQPAQPEGTLN